MGQASVARDYLRWYAEHAVRANGLVSPILNDDGSNYLGFGSDIEYDSQGQFIWLVAEIARLDGGPATVSDYRPHVTRAMRFMQELRERTLVPGYMSDKPAPERFGSKLRVASPAPPRLLLARSTSPARALSATTPSRSMARPVT